MLNSIRNALVHNLEPQKIDEKIEALSQMCNAGDEPLPVGYVKPTDPARKAANAVSFIMGGLSEIGVVASFIEKNLRLPKE